MDAELAEKVIVEPDELYLSNGREELSLFYRVK
jgi:hypothetical protein